MDTLNDLTLPDLHLPETVERHPPQRHAALAASVWSAKGGQQSIFKQRHKARR